MDGYENFGWEVDGNIRERADAGCNLHFQNKVVLHLKRNRKIVNRMELTRLQRNFDACVNEIEALEKEKHLRRPYMPWRSGLWELRLWQLQPLR